MRALKQQQSEWLQGMGILYLAYVRNLYGDIYEHIPVSYTHLDVYKRQVAASELEQQVSMLRSGSNAAGS